MKQMDSWYRRVLILLVTVCWCGGCVWLSEDRQKLDLGVDPSFGVLADSAAFRDTIGAYTYYEGLGPMRVHGYGLVVGLGNNGSRKCPRRVYDRLVQSLYKQHRFSSKVVGVRGITPEQLIDDIDTAVVIVRGEIPPAGAKGTRFDVAVTALPETETKSLRGGRLYTAELQVYRPVSQGASITGQVLARASGPVFLNPFSEGGSATRSNPLEGIIIGAGEVVKDRRIRLVLSQASYQRAQQIHERVNIHFPGPVKVADAVSPSFIRLQVPPEYHDDTAHFLALVRALYLSRDPQIEATRARKLAEEITHPTAPHAQIALAFEGLGRAALPVLDDLYVHPTEYVSFHAAAAGLRLRDHIACDAMVVHAENATGEYRFQAIRALGRAEGMASAAIALRRLIEDEDPRVQIAAYEALVQRGDPTIRSTPIAGDNFILDLVPSQRPNLIYVKRSGSRRIALFGGNLECTPPVLYRAPDGSLTINANPGDEAMTVLRVVPASGSMSPMLSAPFELPALIRLMGSEAAVEFDGEVVGLGLNYDAVVRTLYHLCRDQSVNASFILEQPNVAELFGPPRPAGRPESEL
ncbi:MAG: flagellar basal body P-ring protein FlgI [Phycisphaerae bacterium]